MDLFATPQLLEKDDYSLLTWTNLWLPFLIFALTSSGASRLTKGFFSGAFILQTTKGWLGFSDPKKGNLNPSYRVSIRKRFFCSTSLLGLNLLKY